MSKLRVIGDIHGHIMPKNSKNGKCYANIIKNCEYSVQLGDFGFNYEYLNIINNNHCVLLGNHDLHESAHLYDNILPRYGICRVGPFEFFGVGGAFSIDMQARIQQEQMTGLKTWFPNEQLNVEECEGCLDLYNKEKPRVVMSHSCPAEISELVGQPGILERHGWHRDMITQTQHLLQFMFEDWQPDIWIFGHYHRNWKHKIGKTQFICLDELSWMDFNEKWKIVDKAD